MKLTEQYISEYLLDQQIEETSKWCCYVGVRIHAGWLELKQRRAEDRQREADNATH